MNLTLLDILFVILSDTVYCVDRIVAVGSKRELDGMQKIVQEIDEPIFCARTTRKFP